MDQAADATTKMRPGAVPRTAEDHRTVYDAGKLPHEIEEDIARTRVRLSATIDALERELAPPRVIEKSTEVLRSFFEPEPAQFREQVWAYAIPLALIATGLGWLFMLRRRSYLANVPSGFGDTPIHTADTGEAPSPAPSYTSVAESIDPVLSK
jgi:hypothetical protein